MFTRSRLIVLIGLIVLALVGCNAPTPLPPTVTPTVTITPSHIPTVLPVTVTSAPVSTAVPTTAPTLAPTTVLPTPVPPTSVPLTAVPTRTSTTGGTTGGTSGGTTGGTSGGVTRPDVSKATRVSFQAGATFGTVAGTLNANTTASYVVGVSKGQLMDIGMSSTAAPTMKIIGADGTVLATNVSSFRGYVPSTQDYVIQLTQGSQSAAFSMQITIPERISFSAGATNQFTQGSLKANDIHHYVLHLQANQVMELTFASETGIRTSIYGVDGDVLKSGNVGSAFFRGTMRKSQDYIVQVISDANAVNYTMNVVIPARISFAAGTTSATLTGSLNAQRVTYYVFGASANQQLDIVFTPAGGAKMTIYGIDGTVLSSGMGEGTSFSGKLPLTQDYFLVFQSGASAVNYTLKITIK